MCFQSALRAGGNAALALTNAATMGIVSEARARASASRGQPAHLAVQDRPAQLALQNWHAPGVAEMFPQTQIMMNPFQLAYPPFAQPMRVMTYPHGVNPAALPPSSQYAALPPSSSYDFNEYRTISQEDLHTPPWLRGHGRGYGGPTEVDSIKVISAFSKMTPAQQAMQTKPQLVVPRATKARTKGGAKTIKGMDPVLEFNEAADDPYLMRQQVN